MMRKICVVLLAFILCISGVMIVNDDVNIKAESVPGGGGENNSGIGLDLDYIWNVTDNLSKIIYEYPPGLIPRGRFFGSWGGNYAAKYINDTITALGLENVENLTIGHLNLTNTTDKDYTTVLWANEYSLTVNNPNYPLPHTIPTKELYLMPSLHRPTNLLLDLLLGPTFNLSLNDAEIVPNNMTSLCPFGGTLTNYALNITTYTNLNSISPFIIGNTTYITNTTTIPDAENQSMTVFLLNDIEGCQNQLDNLTNPAACILIENQNKGSTYANATNCTFQVTKISYTDGDAIKNLLENYSTVLVDNVTGNLTFTYNISNACLPFGDYVVIDRIPNHYELYNDTSVFLLAAKLQNIDYNCSNWRENNMLDYMLCWKLKTLWYRVINIARPFSDCKAFILYDSYETHWMSPTSADILWKNNSELPFVGKCCIPTFSMNYTVGSFLTNNHNSTTLTGYMNQSFLKETEDKPAVEAYNVRGNITIDKSPNNAIAIISDRYDGMDGQTPGDSAVGGGIVLGIAKYMTDNNIKPKYNLTFLFTTGEECYYRGAYHYNDSHPYDNIIYWFGLDQNCFNQKDTNLEVFCKNINHQKILDTIINETGYNSRTDYEARTEVGAGFGTEQEVFSGRTNCNTFLMVKGTNFSTNTDYIWDGWHRAGMNYTEGDSLNYIDRNEMNVISERNAAHIGTSALCR